MVRKILIANRGEIVPRIMRTCHAMGIQTVAVYSEADKDAMYLSMTEEAYHIGPANPMKSYLNIEAIMEAARKSGADAVHPGYGFLSENAAFAEAVTSHGMTWVGPSANMLQAIESKCYCRRIASNVDVPVNPGTLDPVTSVDEIARFARDLGYPIFLKLDRGGGGKGIEMVEEEGRIEEIFQRIGRVGLVAFHSSDVYIEKALHTPRHIEVQFLSDSYGACVCLGERECSIQRRHQKIIEEAPSPIVSESDRAKLFDYTTRLVTAMGYHGAGTMEFLRSEDGNYFFMEINARLQVEHPVTEFLTGVDIVRKQLEIASGGKLDMSQQDVKLNGHAIEARIYAEDPDTFMPSPGLVTKAKLPVQDEHLRIDHALEDNCPVPPFYDPMLAKVISWGATREEATDRLLKALEDMDIEGVKTTIPTNIKILSHSNYRNGTFSTAFLHEIAHDFSPPAG